MTQKAHDSHIAQIFVAHFAVDSHTRTLEGGGEYALLNENDSRIDLSKSSESATNLSADSIDSQYLRESSGESNYDLFNLLDLPLDSIDSHDSNTHDSHFDSHFNYSLCASRYAQNNNMPLDSHDLPTNPKANQINSKHESNSDSTRFIVRDDSKLYFNLKDRKWRN